MNDHIIREFLKNSCFNLNYFLIKYIFFNQIYFDFLVIDRQTNKKNTKIRSISVPALINNRAQFIKTIFGVTTWTKYLALNINSLYKCEIKVTDIN